MNYRAGRDQILSHTLIYFIGKITISFRMYIAMTKASNKKMLEIHHVVVVVISELTPCPWLKW